VSASSIWDAIDPTTALREGPTGGYDQGEALPDRQTVAAGVMPWSPQHRSFGFAVVLALTAGGLFYAFERGAGGSVGARAHLGNASAGAHADADLKGEAA
jgi:hypothetical protein